MPRPSSPLDAKASTRCPSHTRPHPSDRASPPDQWTGRNARAPSFVKKNADTPPRRSQSQANDKTNKSPKVKGEGCVKAYPCQDRIAPPGTRARAPHPRRGPEPRYRSARRVPSCQPRGSQPQHPDRKAHRPPTRAPAPARTRHHHTMSSNLNRPAHRPDLAPATRPAAAANPSSRPALTCSPGSRARLSKPDFRSPASRDCLPGPAFEP